MRSPSSARVRAVQVLREVLERGGRATALLAEESRDFSPEDGSLLREIVLGVLRNRARLDSDLSTVSRVPLSRLAPNLREILEVALYQIRHLDRVPSYAAVDEAVSHARRSGGSGAAGLVNAILRNLLRSPLPPPPGEERGDGAAGATSLAREFSHPEFLVRRWLARFGEAETRRILAADNSPSGIDLMTNTRKTDRDSLVTALRAEHVIAEVSPLSPLALTVVSGNPFRTSLHAAGHFMVGDVASQALPLLLPPGDTLVDLAAAPGGKSFSAILHGRFRRAFALDRSVARLSLVLENRARLGLSTVLPAAGDFRMPPLRAGCFERVLLDAPCSGTGTLRKNPEIRYRVTPEAIERLALAQEEGLLAAAALLAPGGRLLFSTCSLEEEENERVVERVLAHDSGLEPASLDAEEGLRPFASGNRFRILPAQANDGFTAHLLRRHGPR
ncbi:MAG TPA: transcription antitermination factor NusB [Thermoanaerobaculia bacterium]|nr:transcription antitermination factor NusB [Thermoanaerobaculia bacterium]